MPLTAPRVFDASSFSIFKRSLMQDDQLPLVDAIDEPCLAPILWGDYQRSSCD